MSSWKTPANLAKLKNISSTAGITADELEKILEIAQTFIEALKMILSKIKK